MWVQRLKLLLAPPCWRLLSASLTVNGCERAVSPGEAPVIFACLHRDIIPAILYVAPARPALLVSESPDGDILTRTLGHSRYGFVRGSSESQGRRAFVEMLQVLASGRSVGVAVDGPRGPFGVVQDGVLLLSRRSGRPIVPLLARVGDAWTLRTWDRTVVPKPLSAVTVAAGDDVRVPGDAGGTDLEVYRRVLTDFFAGRQHEDP